MPLKFRAGYRLSQLLSGRGGSRDEVVNVATEEIWFGAFALIEKLVFDETFQKIGVAGFHFDTHGYAISLLVIVATEWKAIESKH